MLHRKVECPHCGNEIIVNNAREFAKCNWCRRAVKVKFTGYGKRAKVKVEAVDSFEEQRADNDRRNKNVNRYY